ncbi:MAG: prepilin-type N-terminal cleavage/methylation domain-containing protein [Fimbriimonadaceae bacterium]|nr:prepilin-type N-terminal cleavage/methylation domain-containing protein [Fimbriimonadaceae bacterium]
MASVVMRRKKRSGTTLIELLVVIVVFLVGILAVVQIFPTGLATLKTTAGNTLANSLAKSETDRIQGQSQQIPEMIMPVNFIGSGAFISIDNGADFNDLKAPLDDVANNIGRIDSDGNVIIGGIAAGKWPKLSGANLFSRVIGEGRPVPAPRVVGTQFGSLMQLLFAPVYYSVDPGTGIGRVGLLQVYGNDMVGRDGDRDFGIPNPRGTRFRDYQFFTVAAENATESDASPFNGEDQVWVSSIRSATTGNYLSQTYRVAFSFNYDTGSGIRQFDVIVLAQPGDAAYVAPDTISGGVYDGPYTVISLKRLIAKSGLYGGGGFDPARFVHADLASVRVQRVYDEVTTTAAWDAGNPYQYKVLSSNLGAVLVNPNASLTKVRVAGGATVPLVAQADYTVFDWRIIRDEFRVPATGSVKLVVNSIKPRSGTGPDGKPNPGLGSDIPGDKSLWTPDAAGVNGSQDFILQDVESGGVILGNSQTDTHSCYWVDKSNGVVNFRSVAGGGVLMAYVAYPTGDPDNPWAADLNNPVDIAGHSVRALYMARGEYAVQVMKAASSYRVTFPGAPSGLKAGECTVGGSNGWGSPNRLYFSLADYGQKVTVGEIWATDGSTTQPLLDKDLLVGGRETIGGVPLAYYQLPVGLTFDFATNGYSVRRVRGASIKARVLWNPSSFQLGTDQVQNYQNFMTWAQSWRKVTTESFAAGAKD